MATCKECIHEKVCDSLIKSGCPYLDEEIPADVFCIEFRNTADVAEVVRCKDCKNRYVPSKCALWYGTVGDKEYFCERGNNFFCSYGERKE